jgi:flagellar biosynthetic protein FliQ
METNLYLQLAYEGIQTALKLAIPVLALSLGIGFLISIFQAVTSIQEQTLTFVPKIVITGFALILFGPYMQRQIVSFASALFANLHNYVR